MKSISDEVAKVLPFVVCLLERNMDRGHHEFTGSKALSFVGVERFNASTTTASVGACHGKELMEALLAKDSHCVVRLERGGRHPKHLPRALTAVLGLSRLDHSRRTRGGTDPVSREAIFRCDAELVGDAMRGHRERRLQGTVSGWRGRSWRRSPRQRC